jgi:hypothetical protein
MTQKDNKEHKEFSLELFDLINSYIEKESNLNSGAMVLTLSTAVCFLTIMNFGDTQEARDELNKIFQHAWKVALKHESKVEVKDE